MRFVYADCARDGNGIVCTNATVNIYLAGSSTAATVYAASVGGAHINSVTTAADGSYSFWVDTADYGVQNFKVIISLTGFTAATIDNIVIQGLYGGAPTGYATLDANVRLIQDAVTVWDGTASRSVNPVAGNNRIVESDANGRVVYPVTLVYDGVGNRSASQTATANSVVVSDANSRVVYPATLVYDGVGNRSASPTPTANTIPVSNATKDLLDRNSNALYGISGVSSVGALTYVASSNSAAVDLDLGTVTAGDIIYASVTASITLTASAVANIGIGRNSGSATLSNMWGQASGGLKSSWITYPGGITDSTPAANNCFGGYLFVTGSGTLHLFGSVNQGVATVTGNQTILAAFFIKKQ